MLASDTRMASVKSGFLGRKAVMIQFVFLMVFLNGELNCVEYGCSENSLFNRQLSRRKLNCCRIWTVRNEPWKLMCINLLVCQLFKTDYRHKTRHKNSIFLEFQWKISYDNKKNMISNMFIFLAVDVNL